MKQTHYLLLLALAFVVFSCQSNSNSNAEQASETPASHAIETTLEAEPDPFQEKWKQVWEVYVKPFQDDFNEANAGMGSREDAFIHAYPIPLRDEVLVFYRTIIDHSRGGGEELTTALFDEKSHEANLEDLPLGTFSEYGRPKQMGPWYMIQDLQAGSNPYIWFQAEGQKVIRTDIDFRPPLSSRVKFAELDDGASDISWVLLDHEDNSVDLPEEVNVEINDLRYVKPFLLPGNWFALYFKDPEVKCLDVEGKRNYGLMTLYEGSEGFSGFLPSPSGKRIAFANLNPSRYDDRGKIIVLDMQNGNIRQKLKFDANIHYGPKGNSPYNAIVPGTDFWFESEDVIAYRENPMKTDPSLVFGDWDVETYAFKIKELDLLEE